MENRKKFPRLTECDGFMCGQIIKKGSIPVDRVNETELKEFVREYLEASSDVDVDWLIELVKKIFQSQVDEEWLQEMICNIDCESGGGDIVVVPEKLVFPATGGKKTLTVKTNGTIAWYVLN